jgi:hypothetical protein
MTKPLPKDEPWEDPIVAEVRRAREKIFAAAGYDLDELARQLNERQEREGRPVITRSPGESKDRTIALVRSRPNKGIQRTRKKDTRR